MCRQNRDSRLHRVKPQSRVARSNDVRVRHNCVISSDRKRRFSRRRCHDGYGYKTAIARPRENTLWRATGRNKIGNDFFFFCHFFLLAQRKRAAGCLLLLLLFLFVLLNVDLLFFLEKIAFLGFYTTLTYARRRYGLAQ